MGGAFGKLGWAGRARWRARVGVYVEGPAVLAGGSGDAFGSGRHVGLPVSTVGSGGAGSGPRAASPAGGSVMQVGRTGLADRQGGVLWGDGRVGGASAGGGGLIRRAISAGRCMRLVFAKRPGKSSGREGWSASGCSGG